jgi:putative ABC transport system permease protein
MRAITWLRSLWSNVVHRDDVNAALDDEIRTYVDLLAADYEKSGMAPADARRAALVATGGIDQVKEATRDAWAGNAIASVRREMAYAMRTLRRSPGFLIVAIATLAIGIGGATAVFTVIKGSLLRPLPAVPDPDHLVSIVGVQRKRIVDDYTYAEYDDLRRASKALTGVAAYQGTSTPLGEPDSPNRVMVSFVSNNFFDVLGVRPVLGRMFDSTASATTDGYVVVIGHALWQGRFAGSPSVIGSTLKLDGVPYTIIGVAPPGFVGAMALHPMDLWMPVATREGHIPPLLTGAGLSLTSRRDPLFWLVGRLAAGRSINDIQHELDATASRLAAAYPETNAERGVKVLRGAGMTPAERDDLARVPRLLAMAVVVLLLIACGNVAALFLVRASARRRELATRLALGASRAALVRQVALEGILVAIVAAMLGVGIASLLVRSATVVGAVVSMTDLDLAIDRRVLLVAVAATALTSLVVSLAPAFQISHVSPSAVLKDGGGASRRSRLHRVLVGAQVGASLVMLYAAAILFGAFERVLSTQDRYEPASLVDIGIRTKLRDTATFLDVQRRALERVAAEPSVGDAALANTILPFQWSSGVRVYRRGEEPPPGPLPPAQSDVALRATLVAVSPTYFRTVRIPLVGGRGFDVADRLGATPVAIVSRALADALWPRRDPIGQFVAWPPLDGPPRAPLLVVGVADDMERMLDNTQRPIPVLFVPLAQQPYQYPVLLVRGRRGSAPDFALLRQTIAEVDSRIVVRGGRTLASRLDEHLRPQRMASVWVAAFGIIALLLTGIGVYGVVAQGVLLRTRELAIRCALGATPGRVLTSIVGDGLRMAAAGALIGVLAAAAAYRVIQSLFVGVRADAQSTVAAVGVLTFAMLVSTFIPARRAARLNPTDALRSD